MEENPNNHLGCIKPCKWWDKLYLSTGERRISAINSIYDLQDLGDDGFSRVILTSPIAVSMGSWAKTNSKHPWK